MNREQRRAADKHAKRAPFSHRARHHIGDAGAFTTAFHRQQFVDDTDQGKLTLPVLAGLMAISRGEATDAHLADVASAINVALVVVEHYRATAAGAEHEPALSSAAQAMHALIQRGKRTGRYLFAPGEREPIERFAAIYQQQLAAFRRGTFVAAMHEARDRMARGEVIRSEDAEAIKPARQPAAHGLAVNPRPTDGEEYRHGHCRRFRTDARGCEVAICHQVTTGNASEPAHWSAWSFWGRYADEAAARAAHEAALEIGRDA